MKQLLISLLFISFLFSNDKTIFIGTIDSEPKEKIDKFQAIATYLQDRLKEKNIKVLVSIPKDISTAISFINSQKLDIFIDSVYPTVLVQKQTGITIGCKRWKKGKAGYRSVFFTKKDTPISKITDLKGKTIAFEDEFSTSGYYVPKNILASYGLNISQTKMNNSVYGSFVRSEKNTAAWVMFGKVDAAVVDDGTFSEFDEDLFKVIHKSKLIPRHLVSFSKKLDNDLKDEILEIFYNMDKDKDGIETLKSFSKTKKFSKLTDDDLDLIKGF